VMVNQPTSSAAGSNEKRFSVGNRTPLVRRGWLNSAEAVLGKLVGHSL